MEKVGREERPASGNKSGRRKEKGLEREREGEGLKRKRDRQRSRKRDSIDAQIKIHGTSLNIG